MDIIWTKLYNTAKDKIITRRVEPFIEYGNNASAILSSSKNIYSGISITSNSSISSSAEKNAIIEMFNSGEVQFEKMVILNELEELITPTNDCLEYLMELIPNPELVEILIDYEKETIIKLSDLIPDWWGTYRNKKQ